MNPTSSREMAQVFGDPKFVSQYLELRGIQEQVWLRYREIFARQIASLARPVRVLDVGCGPGTFALWMGTEPALFSEVVAIDSSRQMILALAEQLSQNGLHQVKPKVANFLTDSIDSDAFDLILLSEVVHLFESPRAALGRARSMLTENGRIAIRTSTQDQLRAVSWYKYFPAALAMDLARHPRDLANELQTIGLEVETFKVVEPRRWSKEQYLSKLASRPSSTLRAIPLEAFAIGFNRAVQDLRHIETIDEAREMTMFIGSRRSNTDEV